MSQLSSDCPIKSSPIVAYLLLFQEERKWRITEHLIIRPHAFPSPPPPSGQKIPDKEWRVGCTAPLFVAAVALLLTLVSANRVTIFKEFRSIGDKSLGKDKSYLFRVPR